MKKFRTMGVSLVIAHGACMAIMIGNYLEQRPITFGVVICVTLSWAIGFANVCFNCFTRRPPDDGEEDG